MSHYVFLYRLAPAPAQSPQVMQQRMQVWMGWMKQLEQGGHIAQPGNPLSRTGGGVVKDKKGTVSDGPYAESKDIVIGFTVIEAKDTDEALRLARGCPILEGGGLVEVRPVATM